jgi:hypothetical protein
VIDFIITLQFKRFGFRPSEKKYVLALPESWQEVPTRLVLPLYKLLTNYPIADAKVRALQLLVNLPKLLFLSLTDEQVGDLVDKMEWFKIDASAVPLIKEFEHNNITYYLPGEGLDNAAAIEFPLSDGFFEEYYNDNNEAALLLLIATLCREANPDEKEIISRGDKRIMLTSRYEVEARAEKLKGLPLEIQGIVLSYFIGCKSFVFDAYGEFLFKKEEEGMKTQAPRSAFLGWWGIYQDIAESGVFGNLEQVHQTNFHTIALYLVKKKLEADENKAKMDKINNKNNRDAEF